MLHLLLGLLLLLLLLLMGLHLLLLLGLLLLLLLLLIGLHLMLLLLLLGLHCCCCCYRTAVDWCCVSLTLLYTVIIIVAVGCLCCCGCSLFVEPYWIDYYSILTTLFCATITTKENINWLFVGGKRALARNPISHAACFFSRPFVQFGFPHSM